MERRRLGRFSKTAGVIGLTTRRLASPTARKRAEKLIYRAIDLGIDYLDTSREWGGGWGEECLAEVLRHRRREVILACHSPYVDAASSRACLERSLQNLRTDHIDALFIDGVNTPDDLETVLGTNGAAKALVRARREGLIGALGLSSSRPRVLMSAIESGRFDLVQAPYHAAKPRIERSVLPAAVRHDVGVIAEDPWFEDRIIGIGAAQDDEASAAEAIRFVLWNPRISVVLPPVLHMRQLRSLVALANSYQPMSARERRAFSLCVKESLRQA